MAPRLYQFRVLRRFKPYLRLLQACNFEHFHHHNWRSTLRSICHGFCAILINGLTVTMIILAIWYVFEDGYEFGRLIIVLPIQTSIFQLETTFLSLMRKNRTIHETFECVEFMIDRRECPLGA